MFRFPNAIQVKAIHTPSDKKTPPPALIQFPSPDDVAEYATVAGYWTKRTVRGVALLYVGKKVVDTAQQIAIIATTVHLSK